MTSSGSNRHAIPPSMAWLTVFVPALAYYIGSRLQSTRLGGRSLGKTVGTIRDEAKPPAILWGASADLSLVESSKGFQDICSSIWMHDEEELGRGFLLLSQAYGSGRIWRWEVGGGPIPIGRTLYMEPSGCRSTRNCSSNSRLGSGGLTIDFMAHQGRHHPYNTIHEGHLVVAEWGERRIIRVEENGVRTPLVLNVPSLCPNDTNETTQQHSDNNDGDSKNNARQRRIYQPTDLLYTPFGDLVFVDRDPTCQASGLFMLDDAIQTEPLGTPMESRKAHSWSSLPNHNTTTLRVLHTTASSSNEIGSMGGVTLDKSWTGVYFTQQQSQDGPVQLLHKVLPDDDDDDDEKEEEEGEEEEGAQPKSKPRLVYEFPNGTPGPVTMNQNGNLFVGTTDKVVVFSSDNASPLLEIPVPSTPTSLTLGQDRYLYITTYKELYRIRVRHGPLQVPTNLIRKRPKKKPQSRPF